MARQLKRPEVFEDDVLPDFEPSRRKRRLVADSHLLLSAVIDGRADDVGERLLGVGDLQCPRAASMI